jgi:O-antigen ligase
MKHRTDPRQNRQSAGAPSSVPRVNITASRVRSVGGSMLYAASVFFLIQSMGALFFISTLVYGDWEGKGGDKITQTLNLLTIVAGLFLFWCGARSTGIPRLNRVLPLALLSLLLISVLWSVDPRTTLTQSIEYLFVVLGAMGLAESWDSDALMDLLTSICGLCAVASVVSLFILPQPGDFHGIFGQKNQFGMVMAAGVLAGLHGVRIGGERRFRYAGAIALCTVVGFMSKSQTSILAIFAFFGLDILGRLYLRGGSSRIISLWLAFFCIPVVIFFSVIFFSTLTDLIFQLLGKDLTLTGRTVFWPYVIDSIMEKPILGWGFSAFWSPLNPAAAQINDAFNADNWYAFVIPNAHNTLLESLLGIGFVGTSVLIFLWVRYFVFAVKCTKGPAGQFGLSSVILLIGILIIGTTEVVLLVPLQVWTGLFFTMGSICEKKLRFAHAGLWRRRPSTRLPLAAAATARNALRD